jgi:heterodisulfide reductase subunit A
VGNIVLATGYDVFDARRLAQYGYAVGERIHQSGIRTNVQRRGPTNGNVVPRRRHAPKSVAIVHCVGSRDRNYNNYCSAICCMQSLKFAHMVKERTGATVYNCYIDIRTPGKAYDEFYQRVLEEGTIFIHGRAAEVSDSAYVPGEEGKLVVQVEDTLAGRQRRVPVDMVVLSVGLQPRADSASVSKLFGITCSHEGWFIEKHPKLDPVSTMTEGVFIAGCNQGPKDIPASVAQGAAAAARVLGRIQQEEIALEPVRATIDQDRCSGCRICNNLCPFNAITFHEDRMVSEVNLYVPGLACVVAARRARSAARPSRRTNPSRSRGMLMVNVQSGVPA